MSIIVPIKNGIPDIIELNIMAHWLAFLTQNHIMGFQLLLK